MFGGAAEIKICRTALVTLAYQTAPMNRDKAPKAAALRAPGSGDGGAYSSEVIDESWTAVCNLQVK